MLVNLLHAGQIEEFYMEMAEESPLDLATCSGCALNDPGCMFEVVEGGGGAISRKFARTGGDGGEGGEGEGGKHLLHAGPRREYFPVYGQLGPRQTSCWGASHVC